MAIRKSWNGFPNEDFNRIPSTLKRHVIGHCEGSHYQKSHKNHCDTKTSEDCCSEVWIPNPAPHQTVSFSSNFWSPYVVPWFTVYVKPLKKTKLVIHWCLMWKQVLLFRRMFVYVTEKYYRLSGVRNLVLPDGLSRWRILDYHLCLFDA